MRGRWREYPIVATRPSYLQMVTPTPLTQSAGVRRNTFADFEEFFEETSRGIAAFVAVSTGDPWIAEDATQEAFARALDRWDSVSRMDRPDLWVIRVATRAAIDAWRKRRREAPGNDVGTVSPTNDAIRAIWLRWGLSQLSPTDRAMLVLRHRDGLSVSEVAKRLDYSPHTVTKYLKRSTRMLRTVFKEDRRD